MSDDRPGLKHLGIIMDGNGRWAKKRNLPRTAGHLEGLKALKRVIIEAANQQIKWVTFYAFSTENWKRTEEEVSYLMRLFTSKLLGELAFYRTHQIRILAIGDLLGLSSEVQDVITKTVEATKDHEGITAVIAINYGGRDEIVRSVNRLIASDNQITVESIASNLDLSQAPPVDMIVRSAGEMRLSNFLLWESAYAEFGFYEPLWPDWGAKEIQLIVGDYAKRVRTYGGLE
ncbi:MAG TPA: polyprenyl diphosphate synthase [Sphaerochaeta sp.]|jgi:undecaprenyl diphosphate synthase|nr:di-trans,poly-cis-decaprenylcistransferase [Spirochaetales bacterium]HPX29425.1 polyprenyl diphosphate synthase [Sphaerochaeta sp.]